MSTIQIRVDEHDKRAAKRVLDALGLDMSTAIKLFLRQVAIHRGLPLHIVTENGLTIQEERDILTAATEAKRGTHTTRAMSERDALRHLQSL